METLKSMIINDDWLELKFQGRSYMCPNNFTLTESKKKIFLESHSNCRWSVIFFFGRYMMNFLNENKN